MQEAETTELTLPEFERKLTRLFADALELQTDRTIFRGLAPERQTDVLGVIVDSAGSGNYPARNWAEYTVQLLGRWQRRDDALEICRKLDAWLPRYSRDLWIVRTGSAAVFESSANGRKVWEVSCNLKILLSGVWDPIPNADRDKN